MKTRADDPNGLDPSKLRKWRLGESSVAVVLALITAGSSALYTKFQTDQNALDIRDLRATEAQLWAKRDSDKDAIEARLQRIEEKLDTLVGAEAARGHR